MVSDTSFTAGEVAELRKLLEVEKIRKLAQLYSHYMDGRDWDGMASLYAEDALGEWGPYGTHQGRAAIHSALANGHPGREAYDGFHVTTNLWVELTGADTAVSRCYLTDVWPDGEGGPISHPGYPQNPVILYAIYDNDYRKLDGQWLIARSRIQFLWPRRETAGDFPRAMERTSIG